MAMAMPKMPRPATTRMSVAICTSDMFGLDVTPIFSSRLPTTVQATMQTNAVMTIGLTMAIVPSAPVIEQFRMF